jgi:cytochrome P450
LRDPFRFCMKAAAEHDGLARLDVGPKRIYLVSHPDYVQHILVTNAKNFGKGAIMNGIRAALGNGLFTADGELWRRQRRLMQPAFHQRQITQMVAAIQEETCRPVDRWGPAIARGEPIDLLDETIRINIRIVLRTLFGASVNHQQASGMIDATNGVFAGMSRRVWTFFVPASLPLPGQGAFRRAIDELEGRIYAIIAERRKSSAQASDLLGALLAARDDETGAAMTDQQLRDEIFTLFVAGYESTASSVGWTWYLLAQHKEPALRLRAELDERLGSGDPTFEDLAKLPYLRAVVDEAFRLYPAFPMYFRTSIEGDMVGPYFIPPNASIVISPYATHRDARFWRDPDRFDPERFREGRLTQRELDAYYPFGKGQRICIGKAMALTTAQMSVAMLARRFDMQLPRGRVVEPHFALTLQPRGGLPMLLRPRAAGVS